MSALLFFDIDGTLITLDKRHIMPESTRQALNKAKSNGHKIFINTGRVKSAIDKHLLEFGFDGLVCGCGTYIEYEGNEVFYKSIPENLCIKYANMLHGIGYETLFESRDRLFIDGDHGPGTFMNYIFEYFSENSDEPIREYTHPKFRFDKFTTSGKEGSKQGVFEEMFCKDFNLIPHGNIVTEAVPKGCSKATGISFLMNELDVSIDNCYAFGDSINDMEMLKFVGHSVGMGNSVKELFDVVEHKTTDIEDDGIANALSFYNLI